MPTLPSLASANQCFIMWHQLFQMVTSSSSDPESPALPTPEVHPLPAKAPVRILGKSTSRGLSEPGHVT